jgi:hypothetical protein
LPSYRRSLARPRAVRMESTRATSNSQFWCRVCRLTDFCS